MNAIFKKLFCLHQWDSHAKVTPSSSLFYLGEDQRLEKVEAKSTTTEVLFCKECGKVKVIKY